MRRTEKDAKIRKASEAARLVIFVYIRYTKGFLV